jgi:hypothetical protein
LMFCSKAFLLAHSVEDSVARTDLTLHQTQEVYALVAPSTVPALLDGTCSALFASPPGERQPALRLFLPKGRAAAVADKAALERDLVKKILPARFHGAVAGGAQNHAGFRRPSAAC